MTEQPRRRSGTVTGIVYAVALSGLMQCLASTAYADASELPYIDTHAHMEFGGPHRVSSVAAGIAAMIADMDMRKIDKTILMPLPQGIVTNRATPFDYPSLVPVLQSQPERIRLLAGAGILASSYMEKPADSITDEDRRLFRAKAEQIAKLPFISGFGEIPIVHLSIPMMGNMHAYEAVDADHPLLLVLADVAAEHHLPIDVHFDLVPEDMTLPVFLMNRAAWNPNPGRLQKNQDAFERFLAHNPATRIVWSHVGGEPLHTRTIEICRDLLTRYPNLYMSFRLQKGGTESADALWQGGGLKSDWEKLIEEFPERFVVGSDTFYTDHPDRRGGTDDGRANLHRLLTQLPPEVARKVAHDNVYRIYRMEIQIPPAGGEGERAESAAPGAGGAAKSPAAKLVAMEFNSYDLNQDGEITRDEFVTARRQKFASRDTDGQGALSREAFIAGMPPQMPQPRKMMLFKKSDTDSDGKISSDELDANSRQVFENLDTRGSGRLTKSDL